MNIRLAHASDLEVIAAYNMALAHETEGLKLDAQTVREGVRAVLGNAAHGFYFVAEIDEQVAAQTMITFEWSDWRNGQIWWLQSVYVAKPFRGRGAFKALVGFILEAARQKPGVCALRLYMEAHNETARAAYYRLGFTQSNYVVFERAIDVS